MTHGRTFALWPVQERIVNDSYQSLTQLVGKISTLTAGLSQSKDYQMNVEFGLCL